ncbi:MAG: hypothetical protein ABIC18_03520 [Candidatus Omnitrophota bacterium]
MPSAIKKVLILASLLIWIAPLYAQNSDKNNEAAQFILKKDSQSEEDLTKTPAPEPKDKKTTSRFLNFVNTNAYAANVDEKEEKRILRKKWKEAIGVDIFYPYFTAKRAEEWVSDRTSMNFRNIKGRPKLENNQAKYIFKLKF